MNVRLPEPRNADISNFLPEWLCMALRNSKYNTLRGTEIDMQLIQNTYDTTEIFNYDR